MLAVLTEKQIYQKKYSESAIGKAAAKRYAQSEKGKALIKKRRLSIKGQAIDRGSRERYRVTIEGHLRVVYDNMVRRCNSPTCRNYKNYGGRGIRICFKSANEFICYVVDELKVDPRGLSIDRIDNDGNYERGNIQFVTNTKNQQNKKRKCHV